MQGVSMKVGDMVILTWGYGLGVIHKGSTLPIPMLKGT